MADTTELYRGMIIRFNGEPHILIEKEFYSPAKGSAFTKCKLKNIKTGKVYPQIFKSGEKVEELEVQTRNMQYLYSDEESAYFMNSESFEQISVSLDLIPGKTDYLHQDGKYTMSIFEDEVITVQLPPKLSLIITETSDVLKGNTVVNASKEATLETGLKIQVPLFIKTGDKIIINTDNGTYFSKENK